MAIMKEKKHKILFCMHMPPPVHGAAVVGQQIYESQLIRDLYECSYINVSTSTSLDDVGRFFIKKITRTLAFYRQVLSAVKKERPELVYFTPSTSGWAFYRDVITIRLLRNRKQNIVLHLHNKPTNAFLHKWYNRCFWRSFFDDVSAIFLGNALAKQLEEFTPLCKHVFICPNGMPDKAGSVHKKDNDTSLPFTFLFLSNMIEMKGVYVLLEACAFLKQKGYAFRCNFVGQWFDVTKEAFDVKCAQLGIIDCVQAFGPKYGAEKDAFLQQADVFVFPTFYPAECLPLVLIEAMQYALPVISTNEAAIPEIIEVGKTGWIVEKQNASALAEKMEWIINHPQEGRIMGHAGRKKYEQYYDIEHFESRVKEILIHCIEC